MTTRQDPTTLQDDLDALLSTKLPGQDELKARIMATVSAEIRRELGTGDGAPFQLLTADKILTTDWPEPTWAVPELLPVGLSILAGKPKLGKSWMALQIAQAVASGGRALNKQVEAGPVLYLALEDTAEFLGRASAIVP